MSETEDYATTVPWTDVTDKPTEFAPEAHAASHQDGGADEIDATGLAGRVNYVNRGDPTAADWTQATLTTNGTWKDLDCSAIVPAGAKAIIFIIALYDDTAGGIFRLRKNGNTSIINIGTVTELIANIPAYGQVIIPCDTNRTVEYWVTNKIWTIIDLTVAGWLI